MEQLQSWAEKLSLPLYKGAPGQDPASVCYEAHAQAIREGCQYLICDTAGRLHTRHNLMEELSKIRRTLAKQDASAPHYTMLVVDATTGANALAQAREFHKATPLDAVIITKMDGSGKGGVAVAIMDEMQISPAFLGTGNRRTTLKPSTGTATWTPFSNGNSPAMNPPPPDHRANGGKAAGLPHGERPHQIPRPANHGLGLAQARRLL